jgi:hypothetical protein
LKIRNWKEAAALQIHLQISPGRSFRGRKLFFISPKLLGYAHTGKLDSAKFELAKLNVLYDTLVSMKDAYKSKEVEIQMKTGEAWIQYKSGSKAEAFE